MRRYQRKFLADGSLNPRWRPDRRQGDRHKPRSGDRHKPRPGDRHKPRPGDRRGGGPPPFIGVDGEGVTDRDGEHRYTGMRASTGEQLWHDQGLSTAAIFEWLCALSQRYPRAIFVGYATSYDINCWLADLDRSDVEQLWTARDNGPGGRALTVWVSDRLYEVSYRPRKCFSLRRYVEDVRQDRFRLVEKQDRMGRRRVRYRPNYDATITIWDTFSFFQCSFVLAVREWLADLLTPDGVVHLPDGSIDLSHMTAMKQARHEFQGADRDQIMRYCLEECRALVALTTRLRSLLFGSGIRLQRWDGPGAIAAALLSHHQVKAALPRRADYPRALTHAIRSAYAGGRIELLQCGCRVGTVYNYDLRSAYPSIMPELPSLADGQWRHDTGPLVRETVERSIGSFSLYRLRWDLRGPGGRPARAYPFFWRAADGSIYFPPRGEGWHWSPELVSAWRAMDAGIIEGRIEILEAWEFCPSSDARPFAWVHDLFELRQQWKRAGKPEERVLKLGLNSLYGKLAQAVGGTEAAPPTWHCLEWAGYVTARVRAKIYDAMMLHPDAIIMACTDGLYSSAPLEGLDIGPGLGQWEDNGAFAGMLAVQAGVYWTLLHPLTPANVAALESERARLGPRFPEYYLQLDGQWYHLAPHYRGFDPGTLYPAQVLSGWEREASAVPAQTTRFVTLGAALRTDWSSWRRWLTVQRELTLLPTGKRILCRPDVLRKHALLSRQLIPTEATPVDVPGDPYPLSACYQPRFAHGEASDSAWEEEVQHELDLWEAQCE